jgi:hypothetical protein
MALERTPRTPLPTNFVPAGGRAIRPAPTDSFISIARANGLDPMALIEYNFQTRVPEEVNYYLRRNVGCTSQTADGKNYKFSSTDRPGVIYLPGAAVAPVPPAVPVAPDVPNNTGLWIGIGLKFGGHFAIVGKDTFEGILFQVDDLSQDVTIEVESIRVGPGLGGGAAVALAVISGAPDPWMVNGMRVGNWGWDFQLALGNKWSALGKAAKRLPTVMKLVSILSKGGALTRGMGRIALTLAEKEALRAALKSAIDAKEIDVSTDKPQVQVLDIAGPGVEASLYRTNGTVRVHGATVHAGK